jgi:CheY-like chemotaxis protein
VLKILVVEDSYATRVCYRYWCEDLFERLDRKGVVHEVNTLDAAEEKLRGSGDELYQLALVDVSFPVESKDPDGRTTIELDPSAGLKLCEMMGREYPQTPIIVASSTPTDKDTLDFLNDPEKCRTVAAFVPEPFAQETFLEIAMRLLRDDRPAGEQGGND